MIVVIGDVTVAGERGEVDKRGDCAMQLPSNPWHLVFVFVMGTGR